MRRTSPSWLARAEASRPRRPARFRPASETLEGRALLATLVVNPANPSDYPTINAAVAAAQPKDTIDVVPGTYHEKVVVNKPLTIDGAQAGVDARTRNVPTSQESIVDGVSGSSAFVVNANDVTINGFTVQGATDPNNLGAAIDLGAGTSGSHVLDNIIQNSIVGLFLANNSSSDQTVISQNLFRNNNQPGPASGTAIYTDQFVSGGNLSGGNLTNVSIDSNSFTGNNNADVVLAASVSGKQSNIAITGNKSVNDGSFAMLFNTSSSQVIGNTVSGNTGSAAIAVGGGNTNVLIAANTLRKGKGDGVLVDSSLDSQYGYSGINSGITIGLNDISGFGGSGISVATNSLQNSVIVFNKSEKNAVDGIRIDTGNSGNLIRGNKLHDNKKFDAEDVSKGDGTAGTANTWQDNEGGKSNPKGLLGKGHKNDHDHDDDNGDDKGGKGDDNGDDKDDD
jgi:hypothetical protein